MSAGAFIVAEKRLAEALGVPRKVVNQCRADVLEEGTDWAYDIGGNGAVCYSRAGIERTLAHLGLPAQKIAALLPAPPPPPTPALEPPPELARVDETRCEGCGAVATTGDGEGVDLCAECAALLDEDPDEPALDSAANVGPVTEGFRIELLGLLLARSEDLERKAAPPPLDLGEPKPVDVTVTRVFHLNRRIIHGTAGDEPVRVRVKDSQKLRPGMTLRCAHVEDDLYELAERLPRYPGKR